MKKAIGYIRVSTEQQAGDDRFGVEAQKTAILNYASQNDYEITAWKQDNVSGTSEDRPALNEILYGDTYNPPYSAVIAFKSDRIARDTKLYFYYLYTLEKKNIKLLSTQEEFAEGNEFSNIYRALMMFVAEQERKNIALRTSKGRSQKAICGGYAGGRPPYGYKVVNGTLVIEESERPIVEYIFTEKKNGKTYASIQAGLLDNGYRTRKNAIFQISTIQSILSCEKLYKGYYKYGKDAPYVKGVHEAILPDED